MYRLVVIYNSAIGTKLSLIPTVLLVIIIRYKYKAIQYRMILHTLRFIMCSVAYTAVIIIHHNTIKLIMMILFWKTFHVQFYDLSVFAYV